MENGVTLRGCFWRPDSAAKSGQTCTANTYPADSKGITSVPSVINLTGGNVGILISRGIRIPECNQISAMLNCSEN